MPAIYHYHLGQLNPVLRVYEHTMLDGDLVWLVFGLSNGTKIAWPDVTGAVNGVVVVM